MTRPAASGAYALALFAALAVGCVTGRSPSERVDGSVAGDATPRADLYAPRFDAGSWLADRGISTPDTPSFDSGVPLDGARDKGLGDTGLGGDATPAADMGSPRCDGATTCDGPPPVAGRWHQADRKDCVSFCAARNETNVAGPEGARCMSGENRSRSGIAAGITFTYKCFVKDCHAMDAHDATSDGIRCYRTGQKRDHDATDLTVACFCR